MKRAMTFASDEGVYLFLYDSADDGPSTADHLFDTVEAAEEEAADTYAIAPDAWQIIPDPPPGCQHDWISPTRVNRDASGKKLWGQFERVDEATQVTSPGDAADHEQARRLRSRCLPS